MQIANFINGDFVSPHSGAYFDDINPATAEVIAAIPDSDERDVDDAVRAAKAAFPSWSRTSAADRSNLLLKLADLIEKNLDDLARLESIDNGKTISLAKRLDIPRAVANFRFFATALLHQSSDAHVMDAAALNYTLRQPLGVVGLISPWNLPLYLLSWKIAPAIAAGNTCVAKPSELTPLTANRLAELSFEAGIPPGVINIVHGYGNKAGRALTCHDDVAAISFTGGTITGAHRLERVGYFVEPTIVTGLGCDCRVLQEEIFGPVVTITPFDSVDEAVAFANSTRYGLSATIWTRDLSRAHRVAASLDVGTI